MYPNIKKVEENKLKEIIKQMIGYGRNDETEIKTHYYKNFKIIKNSLLKRYVKVYIYHDNITQHSLETEKKTKYYYQWKK